jgi:hypothetical protein
MGGNLLAQCISAAGLAIHTIINFATSAMVGYLRSAISLINPRR